MSVTKHNHRTQNIAVLIVLAVVLAVAVGLVIAWTTTSTSIPEASPVVDTSSAVPAPAGVDLSTANLDGEWRGDANNGAEFVATVVNHSIQIKLVSDDMTMIYWNGTFESDVTFETTIVSNRMETDRAIMSSAQSKDFLFDENKLTFQFEAMGVSRTVVMLRA